MYLYLLLGCLLFSSRLTGLGATPSQFEHKLVKVAAISQPTSPSLPELQKPALHRRGELSPPNVSGAEGGGWASAQGPGCRASCSARAAYLPEVLRVPHGAGLHFLRGQEHALEGPNPGALLDPLRSTDAIG